MNPPTRADGKPPILLFTAGGAASGKSSILTDDVVAEADLVRDGQARNAERVIDEIKLALKHGWKVTVRYIQRPFDAVIRGAIDRSRTGRWAPISSLPGIHMAVQDSIARIAREFAGDDRVEFLYFYNSREHRPNGTTAGDFREIGLNDVAEGGRFHYNDVGELEAIGREELQKAISTGEYDSPEERQRIRNLAGDWADIVDRRSAPENDRGHDQGGVQREADAGPEAGAGEAEAPRAPPLGESKEPREEGETGAGAEIEAT